EHVLVLVHDVEVDRLRLDAVFDGQLRLDLHSLPAKHLVLGTHLGPIDAHVAGIDPVLDARAGIVAQQVRKHLIQPLPGKIERDRQAMSDGYGHAGTSGSGGERRLSAGRPRARLYSPPKYEHRADSQEFWHANHYFDHGDG